MKIFILAIAVTIVTKCYQSAEGKLAMKIREEKNFKCPDEISFTIAVIVIFIK